MYAIEIIDLNKKYGKIPVLKNLNLTVEKGKIYGFLGKNGSGKTTTIKILTGLISRYSGMVKIFGEDIKKNKNIIFEKTGSLVENASFYHNLTVEENLKLFADYKNVQLSKIKEIINFFSLEKYLNVKFKNLSLGNKQRLGMANSVLHDPELLILDEPSNGLDPLGMNEMRNLLFKLSKEMGKTIFVSSHLLSELQMIADNYGIIDDGYMLKELNNEDIKMENKFILKTSDVKNTIKLINKEKIDFNISEDKLMLFSNEKKVAEIMKLLVNENILVYECSRHTENLEEIFIKELKGE